MVLLLSVAISSHAQNTSVQYRISGVLTWGDILTQLCENGYCRLSLPRSFYELTVPISIYENTFDDAFKALSMQAKADGWNLVKTGKKIPYSVSATEIKDSESAYVSCVDSTVKVVPSKFLRTHISADSLKCLKAPAPVDSVVPPISLDRYRINFYVVTSSFLDDIGVDWTAIWAVGDLVSKPRLITDWTFQAIARGDTTAEFRSIEMDIDSVASLHWGSQSKEAKSTYMSGDVVRSDYEYHDYGLTLTLSRSLSGGIRGEYSLAQRDELNSIIEGNFGGGGGDSVSTFGVFDSYRLADHGIPILKNIPILGYLFRNETRDKTKSFFVIEIVQLKKVLDAPAHFDVLDSLKNKEWNYHVTEDSTQDKLDTLDNTEDKEVLDDQETAD